MIQRRLYLMLLLLLQVMLWLILPTSAHSRDVTFAWDRSVSDVGNGTYKIYWGNTSGDYSNVYDFGNVTTAGIVELSDLQTWYFAATYADYRGESGYSNEVFLLADQQPIAAATNVVVSWQQIQEPPPMSYVDSTTAGGNSNLPSVAVPAGVQADDIVILVVAADSTSAIFASRWPTGFTGLYDTNHSGPDGHKSGVAWKRLTGADSGSYTFATQINVTADWVMQAIALRGRHTTTNLTSTSNLNTSSNTNPVTVTATGVTAVAGDDLIWASCPDVTATGVGNGHTAPTDFTEAEDAEQAWTNVSIAYRLNVSAGATGNISGTFALTGSAAGWAGYLIRVPSAEEAPAGLSIPVVMGIYRQFLQE